MAVFTVDSTSIQFFIENTSEKCRLQGLIEAHGGEVVNSPSPVSCHFINPFTDYFVKRPYRLYSTRFIEDSISLQTLQSLPNYEVTQWLPQTRMQFTRADEEIMRGYEADHLGNTFSVLYWQEARDMGLVLPYSAIHLCEHWNSMKTRHPNALQPGQQPTDDSVFTQPGSLKKRSAPASDCHKKLRTSQDSTQEVVDYKPVFVAWGPEGRELLDLAGLESKAHQSKVPETFARLVTACQRVGSPSASEVLKTLVKLNGNIQAVLAYYNAGLG